MYIPNERLPQEGTPIDILGDINTNVTNITIVSGDTITNSNNITLISGDTITNTNNILNNTNSITLLDSNKYDKSGGTISGNVVITGTTNFQENVYFDNKGTTITATGTTFDLSTGNIFINTLTGATEMDYSNATVGTYIWEFNGQTTSTALTFATAKFQSVDGTTPALTATAGAVDSISGYYNGSRMVLFPANNIIDLI